MLYFLLFSFRRLELQITLHISRDGSYAPYTVISSLCEREEITIRNLKAINV
jgi:hypothetical protein